MPNGMTRFPTGGSRSDGGRFEVDWNVTKYRGWWVGAFTNPFDSEWRYVAIMPAHDPWELAVDAFLDFIDRLREGRIPRDVTEPLELMDMAVYAAKRQR